MKIVVLSSGTGRTLENFLAQPDFPRIAGVVVSRRCRAEDIASAAGIPWSMPGRGMDVFDALDSYRPDLVCLAGWLKKLDVRPDYANRVMNIHPSLLPAFGGTGMYGHRVHEAVLARGCRVSGCTVHFVDNEYDAGPIISQRAVPVLDGDGPDDLAARVFRAECEAYPEAVRAFAAGRLEVAGRSVRWR